MKQEINGLSFSVFKQTLEKMRDITDAEHNISKMCIKLNHKYKECSQAGYLPNMASDVVSLLEIILNDKAEWISYWAWDNDFGRKLELGAVKDADGVPIPITTIEELWDFLVDNK